MRNKGFIKLKDDNLMCFKLQLGNNPQLFLNMSSDELNALNDVSTIYMYISHDLCTYYIGQTNKISRRHAEHTKETYTDEDILKYYTKFSNGTLLIFYGYMISGNLNYIESSLIKVFRGWEKVFGFEVLNDTDGNKSELFQEKRENLDVEIVKTILETLKEYSLLKYPVDTKKESLQSILFRHSPFFELSRQQKEIFTDILTREEKTYVVKGGAGTGKTVLLTHTVAKLLGENIENKMKGNSLKRIAVCLKANLVDQIRGIFKAIIEEYRKYELYIDTWPKIIEEGKKKSFDYIFVDESQRLLKYHDNIFPLQHRKFLKFSNKKNVLDLFAVITNKIILFYDENQSIRPTDINKIYDDEGYSKEYTFLSKEVYSKILNTQYRIKVSSYRTDLANNYVKYIKYMLGISDIKPRSLEFYEYDYFKICDEMKEVDNYILDKKEKFPFKNSKIVAGYSRPKNSSDIEGENRKTWHEIDKIWNKNYRKWASTDNDEVGAIHSIQGYDVDYIGVIIGNDIEYRDGEIKINKDNYYDRNGKLGIDDKALLKYVKNIYYTLLTRGIYGIRIFIEDEGLREYWKRETEKLVNENDKK